MESVHLVGSPGGVLHIWLWTVRNDRLDMEGSDMIEDSKILLENTKRFFCLYKAEQMPVPLERIEEWAAYVERKVDTKFAYMQDGQRFYLVTKVYGAGEQ